MNTYNVKGEILIKLDFNVLGLTEKDALEIAERLLIEYYKLDVEGNYQVDNTLSLEVNEVITE